MSISVECPSCQSTFRVREELAGKRGRCPSCKAVLTVPAVATTAVVAASPQIDDDLAPLPPEEARRAEAKLTSRGSAPEKAAEVEYEEDAAGGYVLAGGAAKKAKTVRVRDGALPGVGVSAKGVRQAAAPTEITRTPAEILAAFQGEIEPFRPSPLYSLWLLVVAGFMVLLPLIYVALIGLVISALVYHAVNDVTIFQNARGSGALKIAVLIYLVPLISGAVIVMFMLKPLFAKSAKKTNNRVLDPQVEPLLYAFIDGVCESVGAPRPERIEVDGKVNAAAGYSGGAFSFVTREPVLVIGLGMAAGLNLKQFAGVMAHELGHISQGSGARLMDVISSINIWFARVVYERDDWDQTLEDWSTSGNGYLIMLGALVRLAVWLTRRVLWVLLRVGHLVNMVFLRQREYDADRYEARMVGAKVFTQTCWRLRELQLASEFAMADLQSSWQQRRLPDNFPKLILANVPQIPKETLAAYRQASGQATTGLFDTHPSDRDRIARAKLEEPGEGIFNLDGPATDVFRNFDALARAVTFEYYKSVLGRDISKDQLYPVAELVETQAVAQEGYVAAERFFLKAMPLTQRLALPYDYPKAPTQAKGAKQALVKARNDQQAAREECLSASERNSDVHARLIKAEAASVLLKSDIKLDAEAWGLRTATVKAAEAARDQALAESHALEAEFAPYAASAAQRLTQALAILQVDTVADRVAEGRERREEAQTLYPCASHLGSNVVSQLLPAIRAKQVLELLLTRYNEGKNEKNQPLITAILHGASDLRNKLEELRWKVGDTIYYPFEHAEEDITLARFALPPVLPEKNDVGELLETANAAVDRLLGLYRRALGRLTVTAEEVERVLGLEPIAFTEADEP
ncbi:M48 family metalloprotease [Singulisphaera acidiphila]|uniref:Zn-dependent protease with chaperone function n=1 Tax=Singulisphaera acidiphila (strain ATCC BAA-1392 / DSM 18658 / VKM B-2454 / MOB10) TaxID=886293 RepID=L0D6Q6_SINAD|nr:M48 family metalloprotease [Singulisphaera acidiphila]AGA24550.1 Zn-dependent protease with chaperone function [Singulisphaera acidiphila DSM 18658]